MGSLLVDKRDQLFILHEMLEIEDLCKFPLFSLFAENSKEIFHLVLSEANRFATIELMPTNTIADQEGCVYDPGTDIVKVPECYHSAYKLYREGDWLAMCEKPDVGGQGFPITLGTAVSEVFYAGSFCLYGAAQLTHGAAKLIEVFGTDDQKTKFMKKLYLGEWMGTMCLTEPDAGSDVGAIKMEAVKDADGDYLMSGTKIFISAGEHDLTKNIVHMVLARVKGDPLGTKGLSLFIVPKYFVNEDGSLGGRNDVVCGGIDHKMGIHGLPTATLNLGDKGRCIGYLLGSQGKGIEEMFYMMNEQRLLVGLEGLAISSTAYLHAADYAKNRIQGASVYRKSDREAKSVAIIKHPDVKRMLLWMKAYVEGCRAMTYFTSFCIDQTRVMEGEERTIWQGLVNLLVPVVKAYNTDKSWEITGTAIQCAGGYGYCSDYPFERFARDCKITSIFEGTNGIQAIDLVFRKIIGDKLFPFNNMLSEMNKTINQARKIEAINDYADIVEKVKVGLVEVVNNLMSLMKDRRVIDIYTKATPFLEVIGDVILGWMHLWQLRISYPKMIDLTGGAKDDEMERIVEGSKEASFYCGKVFSSQFYIGSILKRTFGKFEQLKSDESPIIRTNEKSFAS